jgi:hypothetical protein
MTAVKHFTSAMGGAPVLSNNWGDLVSVLDACLVTGFATRTVTGITRSGSVATATTSTPHTYLVDQVVENAGANQTEYNGQVRVIAVTGSTYTFAVAGTPATPATTATSITAKVAPLGFQKVFAGTNKAVYRSQNTLVGNRRYLRVDNSQGSGYTATYAKFAKVTIAEGMTDIDTFTGARAPFDPGVPNKNEETTGSGTTVVSGWHKWYHAKNNSSNSDLADGGVGARTWVLVGDDRRFYFHTTQQTPALMSANDGKSGYAFVEFESLKTGDAYNTLLCAHDCFFAANAASGNNGNANNEFESSNTFTGKVLLRDFTQIGNPVRAAFFSGNYSNALQVSGFTGSVPFPNGPGFSVLVDPVRVKEELGHVRGFMPGLFHLPQKDVYADLVVLTDVAGYPGRKFLIVTGSFNGQASRPRVAYDITGPWV